MRVIYFRVDRRKFNVGSYIETGSNYQDTLDLDGIKIEKFLEKARPSTKPKRKGAVFVFDKWENAEKFCFKMTDGIIYTVEVSESDIEHKADMQLTERMKISIDDPVQLNQYASDYWAGATTNNPITEIIVCGAKVLEIKKLTQAERRAIFLRYYQ